MEGSAAAIRAEAAAVGKAHDAAAVDDEEARILVGENALDVARGRSEPGGSAEDAVGAEIRRDRGRPPQASHNLRRVKAERPSAHLEPPGLPDLARLVAKIWQRQREPLRVSPPQRCGRATHHQDFGAYRSVFRRDA